MHSPSHSQLTKTMGGVVQGLDKVMQSMDLEKVGPNMAHTQCLHVSTGCRT